MERGFLELLEGLNDSSNELLRWAQGQAWGRLTEGGGVPLVYDDPDESDKAGPGWGRGGAVSVTGLIWDKGADS